jgi:hypothetical protein
MGPGYFMVASSHMGQIRLLLFARNDVYAAISDVRTGKQATGVAGVATNKVRCWRLAVVRAYSVPRPQSVLRGRCCGSSRVTVLSIVGADSADGLTLWSRTTVDCSGCCYSGLQTQTGRLCPT